MVVELCASPGRLEYLVIELEYAIYQTGGQISSILLCSVSAEPHEIRIHSWLMTRDFAFATFSPLLKSSAASEKIVVLSHVAGLAAVYYLDAYDRYSQFSHFDFVDIERVRSSPWRHQYPSGMHFAFIWKKKKRGFRGYP